MILVGLGSNMDGPWGTPRATVERALAALDRDGMRLEAVSRLLVSSPFGRINQPPFVNAVVRIATHLPPAALMRRLHAIERAAGRRRGIRWGPRTLDLDLIDYHGLRSPVGARLKLPHPGIAERQFVLGPIAEIAPSWKHPTTHLTAAMMLRRLAPGREGREI